MPLLIVFGAMFILYYALTYWYVILAVIFAWAILKEVAKSNRAKERSEYLNTQAGKKQELTRQLKELEDQGL